MLSLLATIGKILPRRPDFVVVMHATNDIGTLNRYGTYWNDSGNYALVKEPERSIENLFRQFRDMLIPNSYRRLRRGLKTLSDAGSVIPRAYATEPPQAVEVVSIEQDKWSRIGADFESALRSYVAVVRAWHSQPVLMTQVLVRANQDGKQAEGAFLSREALAAGQFTPESFTGTHEYFNAIIRQVAYSEGVPLIDLAAATGWSAEHVYDGLHFTDAGSKRVAEIAAEALAAQIGGADE